MANNTWKNYTQKSTALSDNDEVMLLDSTDEKNKRGLMSKFWDYVVDKMATAVISKLETNNKTIIGAINALNSDCLFEPKTIFRQTDTSITLQFAGITETRAVSAILLLSGQVSNIPPINVCFGGAGTVQDISSRTAYVSENNIGITCGKNDASITIPNFGGDWGIYKVLLLDKRLSVSLK